MALAPPNKKSEKVGLLLSTLTVYHTWEHVCDANDASKNLVAPRDGVFLACRRRWWQRRIDKLCHASAERRGRGGGTGRGGGGTILWEMWLAGVTWPADTAKQRGPIARRGDQGRWRGNRVFPAVAIKKTTQGFPTFWSRTIQLKKTDQESGFLAHFFLLYVVRGPINPARRACTRSLPCSYNPTFEIARQVPWNGFLQTKVLLLQKSSYSLCR